MTNERSVRHLKFLNVKLKKDVYPYPYPLRSDDMEHKIDLLLF